ncbi:MAG: putative zinc-binding metallopeptidase [Odoribacteraceae bacterium]|jgi:hypothetical protein|nr:putative zinc-binding metallopeptidase [Odoribacteraceae bacterium]
MKYRFIIMAFLLAGATACDKTEELNPRTGPENVAGDWMLPQGDHDYDDYIADFLERYNTLILYKYDPVNIYWNITSNAYSPVHYDTAGNVAAAGYADLPADEEYIDEQLELIKTKFLDHYPDDFLAGMLPKKILLVKSFNSIARNGTATDAAPASGVDYLLFQWGGEEILTMTPGQVNTFKTRASDVFLRKLVNSGKIERDPVFLSISNYATTGSTNPERIANGFIAPSATVAAEDWNAYVTAIVSTPYDTLVAPRGTLPITNFVNRRGILTPGYDTGGLIRKKYDAMIAYFRDIHGIDLQAIGDDHER